MSQPAPKGIVGELSGTFASARWLLSSLLELFSLEARRAGLTLVLMLACGTVAAILVVAAWLGLLAALVLWSVYLGVSWEVALAQMALAKLALAALLWWLCAWMSRALLFAGTRRQLQPGRLKLV